MELVPVTLFSELGYVTAEVFEIAGGERHGGTRIGRKAVRAMVGAICD
jgi:hypothetical protein